MSEYVPMTIEQLIDCLECRPAAVTRRQMHEAAQHLRRLSSELASAQAVVRQVSADTYGEELTVKEFANRAGYDS